MLVHERRRNGWFGLTAVAVLLWCSTGGAQSALRLRGSVQTPSGSSVGAAVELEAVHGFRGLEFVGQKTFKARPNDKGQWSVLGVTSGVWVMAAHTPQHLPHVMVFPIQFSQKNPASAVGGQVPWDVGFELVPREAHPELVAAADAALAGRRAEVAAHLAPVFETASPEALVVAAEIALYVRDAGLARGILQRALAAAPSNPRAHLALASAALIDGAWDAASKALWAAREAGAPPRIVKAVGAAITELQRISVPDGRRECPGCGAGAPAAAGTR